MKVINDTQKEAIKEKMKKSVLFMAAMFFPDYMYAKSSDFHKDWINMLNSEKEKVCIIAPRGHAKSVVISIFWIVWRLLFTNSHYIILISNTRDKARDSLLLPIKSFFETNLLVKALFGDVRGETWGKTALEFFIRDKHGNIISKKKIDIFGVGQSIRGARYLSYRPDTLVADDIEDDEQVENDKRRGDIINWFWEQVYPAMNKEGDVQDLPITYVIPKMVVVGTILHYDSFLINIWKNYEALKNAEKDSEWIVRKDGCIYIDKQGKRQSLWKERYTVEYWDNIREKYKAEGREASFMQEYMNEPMSDEERPIKIEHIQYYKDEDIEKIQLEKYLAVDIAGANTNKRGGQKRDYNVVIVIGIDRGEGNIYVLDYDKFQTNDYNTTVNAIFEKFITWSPKYAVYEKSAQQGYLEKMVKTEQAKRGIYFPFVAKTPENISKEVRITQVLGFNVGRKKVFIRHDMRELYDEMFAFPRGKLKDLIDALTYAILASEKGRLNFRNYMKEKTKIFLHKNIFEQRRLERQRENNKKRFGYKYVV